MASKVRGAGVAISAFSGGSTGFDGLFIIKPDGRVQFQSGIGNHGTHSVIDVHRVAAEMIGVPLGAVRRRLGQHGQESAVDLHLRRQPDDPRDDARRACSGDRRHQEAAGNRREDARRQPREPTRSPTARVSGPGGSMTLAQAAQKAIELGGKYDGHELPNDINAFTKTSAAALVGLRV